MAKVLLIVEPNTKLDKLLNKMLTAYQTLNFTLKLGSVCNANIREFING